MKRSELLKYLIREFTISGTNPASDAERVLANLEKFGMLPPAKKLTYYESEPLRSWSLIDQIKGYHSWDKE